MYVIFESFICGRDKKIRINKNRVHSLPSLINEYSFFDSIVHLRMNKIKFQLFSRLTQKKKKMLYVEMFSFGCWPKAKNEIKTHVNSKKPVGAKIAFPNLPYFSQIYFCLFVCIIWRIWSIIEVLQK